MRKETTMPHTLSAEQKKAMSEAANQIAAQLGETEHVTLTRFCGRTEERHVVHSNQ
jgi:hypothetical protein